MKTATGYACAGYFRADNSALAVTVRLKVQLPDGSWMTLASAKLPRVSQDWRKYSIPLVSGGQSDRVVVELRTEG